MKYGPPNQPLADDIKNAVCNSYHIEKELLHTSLTHSTVAIPRNICLLLMHSAGLSAREAGDQFELSRSAARKQIINTRREMEASKAFRAIVESIATPLDITIK